MDDDVFLVSPSHGLLNLLQKDLRNSSTQSVHCLQELQLERIVHGLEEIVLKGKLKEKAHVSKTPFNMQTAFPKK